MMRDNLPQLLIALFVTAVSFAVALGSKDIVTAIDRQTAAIAATDSLRADVRECKRLIHTLGMIARAELDAAKEIHERRGR
jgi:hypothetical protein